MNLFDLVGGSDIKGASFDKAQLARRGAMFGADGLRMKKFHEEQSRKNFARHGIEQRIPLPNTSVDANGNPIGPGVAGSVDRQYGYIWDTLTVAANTAFPSLTTMFSVPQQGSTKPLTATNLRDSGKLTYPERMDVLSVRCYLLNNITVTDLLALFTNVSLQVHLNNGFLKYEGLIWMTPAGGGADITGGFQVGTAPTGSAVYHATGNGISDIRNVADFSMDPIQLGAGENFDTVVQAWTPFNTQANTTNPPGTGVTLVMAFEGQRFKPFGG